MSHSRRIALVSALVMLAACQDIGSPERPDPVVERSDVVRIENGGRVGPLRSSSSPIPQSVVLGPGEVVVPAALATVFGNNNNILPHSVSNVRYQQVFLASELGPSTTFRELCLRPDEQFSSPSLAQQLSVKLGPTSLGPADLGADFANNYSAAPTVVFSGTLTMPITNPGGLSDWVACVPFTTPFNYVGGNLVVEMINTSTATPDRWIADWCESPQVGCNTTRVYSFDATAPTASVIDRNHGLAMRFSGGTERLIAVAEDAATFTLEVQYNGTPVVVGARSGPDESFQPVCPPFHTLGNPQPSPVRTVCQKRASAYQVWAVIEEGGVVRDLGPISVPAFRPSAETLVILTEDASTATLELSYLGSPQTIGARSGPDETFPSICPPFHTGGSPQSSPATTVCAKGANAYPVWALIEEGGAVRAVGPVTVSQSSLPPPSERLSILAEDATTVTLELVYGSPFDANEAIGARGTANTSGRPVCPPFSTPGNPQSSPATSVCQRGASDYDVFGVIQEPGGGFRDIGPVTIFATPPPPVEEILFEFSDGSGEGDLFVVEATGNNLRDLSLNMNRDLQAMWSPDGSKIVFHRKLTPSAAAAGDIWVMNADGSGATNLTASVDKEERPTWHPSGSQVAFTRIDAGGDVTVTAINVDGTGQVQLTPSGGAREGFARYSPDGAKVAYLSFPSLASGIELIVANADGTNPITILPSPNGENADLFEWSPDGTKLVTTYGQSIRQIFVVNADGSGSPTPLTTPPGPALPVWSPDGTTIAFRVSSELWLMNSDGSGQRMIGSAGGRPDWSADGSRLAALDPNGGILVLNADGSNPQTITGFGRSPRWRP